MLISRKLRRRLTITFALLALLALWSTWYVRGFALDTLPVADAHARPEALGLVVQPQAPRGRVLAVVSSAERVGRGEKRKRGGFELTELARAWFVFTANGFAVDVASPEGGRAPVVIDEDLTDVDHAFLNDARTRASFEQSLGLDAIDPDDYDAVYFVGGKGAMEDFHDDRRIGALIRAIDERGGVIGAVCHGPAALLAARRDDGTPWVASRRLTSFSNDEELFLIEDAREVFGELLSDRLASAGAQPSHGPMFLDHVVVDGRLVTGQNPWATYSVAEAMLRAMGVTPIARSPTPEEQAVRVLAAYRKDGFDAALALQRTLPQPDRRLVLLHALIAAMRGEWHHGFQLQRLARG